MALPHAPLHAAGAGATVVGFALAVGAALAVDAVVAEGALLTEADALGLAVTEAVGFGLFRSCPMMKAKTITTAIPIQKTPLLFGLAWAVEGGMGGVGGEIGGVVGGVAIAMILPCFSG